MIGPVFELAIAVISGLVLLWSALGWLFVQGASFQNIQPGDAWRAYRWLSALLLMAFTLCVSLIGAFAWYFWMVDPAARGAHFECNTCTWADFLYLSLLTFLGNGDLGAKSPFMRLVASVEIVTGFVVIVFLFAMIVSLVPSFTLDATKAVSMLQARLRALIRRGDRAAS